MPAPLWGRVRERVPVPPLLQPAQSSDPRGAERIRSESAFIGIGDRLNEIIFNQTIADTDEGR